MRAGRMRHRITALRRQPSYDNLGHEQDPWKPIAVNYPAEVVELTGRELERFRQLEADVTIRITMRRSPAKQQDRIQWGARILDVISVIGDERNTEQTILCREDI